MTTAYCCGNPVAIDPAIDVVASSNLTGATVAIDSGFVSSEDVLVLPSPIGSITASYSADTGVLTSAGENAFVVQKASGNGWMGASTNGINGFPRTWQWATGPEAGESFFFNSGPGQGTTSGSNIPYANWASGEPNDSGGTETVGEFYGDGGGLWNDLQDTISSSVNGYFCEYGGIAGDPVESLQGSKTLVFLNTRIALASSANPSEPGASVTTATPNACGVSASAYCTNFVGDSKNCGGCGTVCPSGETCDGTGHCASAASPRCGDIVAAANART